MTFYIAYDRKDGPSFRVLNIDHDLDTADGLLSFIEWYEKEIGETFVMTFWKRLKTEPTEGP